jgi:hypothetical protein
MPVSDDEAWKGCFLNEVFFVFMLFFFAAFCGCLVVFVLSMKRATERFSSGVSSFHNFRDF